MGIKPCRTAYRSPWQNGVAERWIGICRRELLNHVIVFDRQHFIWLIRSYINYYHEDRCHLGLAEDAPNRRVVTTRPSSEGKIVALPRVGGLPHLYAWRDAARASFFHPSRESYSWTLTQIDFEEQQAFFRLCLESIDTPVIHPLMRQFYGLKIYRMPSCFHSLHLSIENSDHKRRAVVQ